MYHPNRRIWHRGRLVMRRASCWIGHLAWDPLPVQGQEFVVAKVEHIFCEIENRHIGHKLMVALKLSGQED